MFFSIAVMSKLAETAVLQEGHANTTQDHLVPFSEVPTTGLILRFAMTDLQLGHVDFMVVPFDITVEWNLHFIGMRTASCFCSDNHKAL